MMSGKYTYLLGLFILIACANNVLAQSPGLKSTLVAIDTMRSRLPAEKLYLQTDRPNYTQGDTLWFKAYMLDAGFLTPSVRSGLLYIELDDQDNKAVKRMMTPVASGLSWGDMALAEADIPAGSYTLRAYTNWQRNFGKIIFLRKTFIKIPTCSSCPKAAAW